MGRRIKPGDTVVHQGVIAVVEQVVMSRNSAFVRSEVFAGWASLDGLLPKEEGKVFLALTVDEARTLLKYLEGQRVSAVEWTWTLDLRTKLHKMGYETE